MVLAAMKGRALALRVALFALVGLVGGCSGQMVEIASPSSSPYKISVDCGPSADDVTACLAMVAAAAKIIPAPPGSRAVISNGTALGLPTVTIISPDGSAHATDIAFNPSGEYVGVNPRSSP